MKVDVLGLGMLGCMNRAFNLLREPKGGEVGMDDLQDDDPAVYGMIQKADTLGVFQIESRAQLSMLPRIKPKCFYDLLLADAIVDRKSTHLNSSPECASRMPCTDCKHKRHLL